MNKGDLVTVLTNAGEFVGRLDKNDDTGVHLDNPKMIVSEYCDVVVETVDELKEALVERNIL